MKTFIYTKKITQRSNGFKTLIKLYSVKSNLPSLVARFYYYSGSNYGENSEIARKLVSIKLLPKSSLCSDGFINTHKLDIDFRFISL